MTEQTLAQGFTVGPESTSNQDASSELSTNKEQKRIVDWAKQQYERAKQARAGTERQWYLNLAFYFGKQNMVPRQNQSLITTASGTLYTPPAPYYRVRPVINRIRPTIRTELAKLTSQRPNAFVIPASSEDRDLFAAQAGEQIWDSIYRKYNLKNVIRKALFWTLTCGSGYIKSYWDPTKVDEENNQLGDFAFEPETPFHVFVPDLRVQELEEQPFIIHAQLKSIDWVKLNFPELHLNIPNKAGDEILEDSWLNMVGASSTNDQHKVLVLEVWVKPHRVAMFPEGAVFTVIGDQLAQGMYGWPYEHNRYPFAKIDHIPGGKFYADSSIVDLIPLQREYNRTRGQIIEAKNRMAKPQLAAEKGSIDPSKITSEPGQVILYTPGFNPPQPIPLQNLPGYVLQELDRILLDWADIAGIHEVSQGQVPPGVTAATAISYLQEQDETKLSHTVDSLESAIEKTAQMALSYVTQFWDASRTVKVTGMDGTFDVMAFRGSDLRGNTDIKIESGSALPTSRAAKQALIMDFMKMGFIAPDEGMEVLELGGINKIYDRLQIDKKQAQRENLKMAKVPLELLEMHLEQEMERIATQEAETLTEDGIPLDDEGDPIPPNLIVPVNTYDNHAIHIMVHNDFRKSQSFENMPEHIKELFEQHVNQHIASLEMLKSGEITANMGPMGEGPVSSGGSEEEEEEPPVQANPPMEGEEEDESGPTLP